MLQEWLNAARPKTLTASVIPVIVGTALTKACDYQIHWWITILALFSAMAIQIGTNLVNDAADFKRGADDENRVGPRRMTQSGVFTYKQVMISGGASFAIAAILGLPLIWRGGWPILVIGVASIACGYLYTMSPVALAYNGLADLFVVLFFGLIAVGGLFFLQTQSLPLDPLIAGVQVGMLATALLAVNNLRDIEGDRRAGKRTLAVRFGERFARAEILFMTFVPFLLSFFWIKRGFYLASLLPFLVSPVAWRLVEKVYKFEPGTIFNRLLARAAFLHFLFGLLLNLGFLLK
ncbi:1,4-dihydroxy-2-naphthoate octaprenyltransferase [Syntrophobacter sp. SbD1]|nr:1,4-dihydroxy-2-naphthoate octaprenyltransferase [Syntrophobacter sp. SbD1]